MQPPHCRLIGGQPCYSRGGYGFLVIKRRSSPASMTCERLPTVLNKNPAHQLVPHITNQKLCVISNNISMINFMSHPFPGRGFGGMRNSYDRISRLFGGMRNPGDMFSTRGHHHNLLGNNLGYSRHGYDCDFCIITYDGQHICECRQELEMQLAQIQGFIGSGGCGCPDCPFDRYGYGGGGHSL